MAFMVMYSYLDLFQLLCIPALVVALIGLLASGRLLKYFSVHKDTPTLSSVHKDTPTLSYVHKDTPTLSSVIKDTSEPPSTAFFLYRALQDELDLTADDDRQTTDTDYEYSGDLHRVVQSFGRLSLYDTDQSRYGKYDESEFQDQMNKMVARLEKLLLEEEECELLEVVIDYRCVTDRRKEIARRNVREMLRKRERRKRQELERLEAERRARAEVLEKERLLKMKRDWLAREEKMKQTASGRHLLQHRRQRAQKNVATKSLRVTLLKSLYADPHWKHYLPHFD